MRAENEQVCINPSVQVTQPRIEQLTRPATADGEPHGLFVGMSWGVARPQGFPAVSHDARWVAYWVGEASVSTPMPFYGRQVVVRDLASNERDRTLDLLRQEEFIRALPRGEVPTPDALTLSEERFRDLETRVEQRVARTNAWLGTQRWAPMNVCLGDGSINSMRVGELRVSLESIPKSRMAAVTIHDTDGALLARHEEGPTECTGELRLASVAIINQPRVVLVEVAETGDDSCSAPNRVFAYGVEKTMAPAPLTVVPHTCEAGQALTEDERASLLWPYARSDLAVFRVGPNDPLNLRTGPGAGFPIAARLPCLSDGLRHTGGACRVDGATWLEVEYGEWRGWVNERFVSPVGSFEELEAVGETPIASFAEPTLAALGIRLQRALAREQSQVVGAAVDVEVLGQHERGAYGQVALFLTPMAGDSISGIEYVAHALRDAGQWRAVVLEQRNVCSRGSDEGQCV